MSPISFEEMKTGNGTRGVTASLVAPNAAAEARFLTDVFGFQEYFKWNDEKDKDKIVHSAYYYEGRALFAEDNATSLAEEHKGSDKPLVKVYLNVDDAKDLEKKLLENGGRSVVPVAKQFWGANFGVVADAEGICWAFSDPDDATKQPLSIPRISERKIITNFLVSDIATYVDFLKKVFGAVEARSGIVMGGKLMHQELVLNYGLIAVSGHGPKESPGVCPVIEVPHGQGLAVEARAVAAGAKVMMKTGKKPWGPVYGHFASPNGFRYSIEEEDEAHHARHRIPFDIESLKGGAGMRGVTPALMSTNCAGHAGWLKKSFDAETFFDMKHKEKTDKTIHAAAFYDGRMIFSEDASVAMVDEYQKEEKSSVHLYISVDDVLGLEKRLLENGAKSKLKVEKQFWGAIFGIVQDPWGISWAISQPGEEGKSPGQQIPDASDRSIVPDLAVDGAHDYIEFLKKVFGAKIQAGIMTGPDNKVMHCELEVNHGLVYVADLFGEFTKPGVAITMQVPVGEGTTYEKRALDAGGKSVMKVEKQFWGDIYGRVKDAVDEGIEWAIIEAPTRKRARDEENGEEGDGKRSKTE